MANLIKKISELDAAGAVSAGDLLPIVQSGATKKIDATLFQGDVGPAGPAGADGAGTGDVMGPASAVDSNLASFDTITGKLIKDSGIPQANVAIKSEVTTEIQNAVVGMHTNKGSYDAATNTPDLDTVPTGISNGDFYTVSVAGVFFTKNMEAGDVLIADQDNPTLLSHWTRLQKNLDAAGIKIAYESNADTNAYDDAEKAKLATVESGATADMTGAEIKTAYELESNTNAFEDLEKAKLAMIDVDTTLAKGSVFIDTNQVNGTDQSTATTPRNVIIGHDGPTSVHARQNLVVLGYNNAPGSNYRGVNDVIIGADIGNLAQGNCNGNILFGSSVGRNINAAANNIFMGWRSGYAALTVNDNIYLGRQSGYLNSSGSNNICLGQDSDTTTTTTSNEIVLGGPAVTNLTVPMAGFNLSTSLLTYTGQYALKDGTSLSPSIGFENDVDTGIYSPGAGQFNITAGGISRLSVTVSKVKPEVPIQAPNGTLTDVSYSFAGMTNGGLGRDSAENSLYIACEGQQNITFLPDGMMEFLEAWDDLTSEVTIKGSGAQDPSWSIFRDGIEGYAFSSSSIDQVQHVFHVKHDYKMGTVMYPHVHMSPNTTSTGVVRIGFEYTLAKGHNQATGSVYGATTTIYKEYDITVNSQYKHIVSEVAIGDAIPATLLEPDTVIKMRMFRDATHANDTFPDPIFIDQTDLHYQKDRFGTLNKSPSFYA